MGSLVSNEIGAPAETLAALGTLKGFLTRVDPLVGYEVCTPAKAFPTIPAFIRFLPGVSRLMPTKV